MQGFQRIADHPKLNPLFSGKVVHCWHGTDEQNSVVGHFVNGEFAAEMQSEDAFMGSAEYQKLMETIKNATANLFETAETEEGVCELERALNQEIMYLAAVAQSERVMPPGGWDQFGRQ